MNLSQNEFLNPFALEVPDLSLLDIGPNIHSVLRSSRKKLRCTDNAPLDEFVSPLAENFGMEAQQSSAKVLKSYVIQLIVKRQIGGREARRVASFG